LTLTKIQTFNNVKTFRRNHFFSGRMLTAADLEREQNYFRDKLKLHNRLLHGFGIVNGLEVSIRGGELHINGGFAIDCEGNEIVVAERVTQALPATSLDTCLYLTIHYREQLTDFTPTSGSSSEAGVIEEGFALEFESQNPNQNHKHAHGRWRACGKPHGLVLARLRKSSGQWRIDRRLRRLLVK
jgi:hypothetical protein